MFIFEANSVNQTVSNLNNQFILLFFVYKSSEIVNYSLVEAGILYVMDYNLIRMTYVNNFIILRWLLLSSMQTWPFPINKM